MQLSLARMIQRRNQGEVDLEPKDFPHVKRIRNLFDKAKKKAWAQINQEAEIKELIAEEKEYKRRRKQSSLTTIQEMINMPK